MTEPRRADCAARDELDALAPLRDFFDLPEGLIYLDGNSLGPLPRPAIASVKRTLRTEWGQGLIGSWDSAGWWDKPLALGARIAPLIGARPEEVIVGDSTSVNTFKVVIAALRMQPDRRVVVTDRDNFPTDLYIIDSAAELAGDYSVRRVETPDDLAGAIDRSVALVALTHVDYRSARLLPMNEVTRTAHDNGAVMIWDLSHSVGSVPLAVDACDVDFAVGCTYKFLNGGPGSPAFVFAAARLHDAARQPLAGWHGHARPLAFQPDYEPAPGIRRFACGTPPILSYASLEGSLEIWEHVEPAELFAKGQELCDLLIELLDPYFVPGQFELVSPRESRLRGSQVALRHPQARSLLAALAGRGVIGDYREPDLVRLGIAPLYLRFVDIWDAADAIRDTLSAGPVE